MRALCNRRVNCSGNNTTNLGMKQMTLFNATLNPQVRMFIKFTPFIITDPMNRNTIIRCLPIHVLKPYFHCRTPLANVWLTFDQTDCLLKHVSIFFSFYEMFPDVLGAHFRLTEENSSRSSMSVGRVLGQGHWENVFGIIIETCQCSEFLLYLLLLYLFSSPSTVI